MLFLYLLIFIFGAIIGSFLNCLIYRLERGESFIGGRSHCPHCGHTLAWNDLIPIVSFFLLKGRCRYCHQKISLQYPLVEFATGLLFALIFWQGSGLLLGPRLLGSIYYWIISSFLIIIFVYDLKHYLIPDKIVYPAAAISLLFISLYLLFQGHIPSAVSQAGSPLSVFGYSLLSAFGASAFFLAIVLVSGEKWMGWGDVKLAFLMGLFLGWPRILAALFLAFFFGSLVGLALVLLNKKTMKSEIPFGPFLVAGTILSMFFSLGLFSWY